MFASWIGSSGPWSCCPTDRNSCRSREPGVTELTSKRNLGLLCGRVGSRHTGRAQLCGIGKMGPEASNRVLVVDDEWIIRAFLADGLADAGYQVLTARNGAEALDRIRRDQPHAVLLD